jgi:undecaprenyl-diphosphatase
LKNIIVLSIVQGICEWFPISSSGHLFLFHKILGMKPDVNLDIFLHFPSLLAILIFFRIRILNVLKGFFSFNPEDENFKIGIYIISASIITGIIGFLIHDKEFLENRIVVSTGFLITTILLFLSSKNGAKKIDFKSSIIIGFFQGLALLPGISRSGATISIAKIYGINNEDAFSFSFLLAIPAIIGAILLEINKIKNIGFDYILVGFLITFFLSIITLSILRKIFLRNKFQYFCIYTFIVFLISLFIK